MHFHWELIFLPHRVGVKVLQKSTEERCVSDLIWQPPPLLYTNYHIHYYHHHPTFPCLPTLCKIWMWFLLPHFLLLFFNKHILDGTIARCKKMKMKNAEPQSRAFKCIDPPSSRMGLAISQPRFNERLCFRRFLIETSLCCILCLRLHGQLWYWGMITATFKYVNCCNFTWKCSIPCIHSH